MELDDLRSAILNRDVERAVKAAKACLKAGIDPLKALDNATQSITELGELFEKAKIFLPDVMIASIALRKASEVLLKNVPKTKQAEKRPKYLIGTVEGDVHDIGKSIVATMLNAGGFEVIDIGRDVPTEKFVEAVRKHKPEFLGLSALLTTTSPVQGLVIEALKKAGLRSQVKVMIGGGTTTEWHAEEIGADGWARDAVSAVAKAKELLTAQKME